MTKFDNLWREKAKKVAEIAAALQKKSYNNYEMNQSISGYWRLVRRKKNNDYELILDDSANEDVNGDKETAAYSFANFIFEYGAK